ncbi:MAG: exosortase C-terminal domain/associated protein EpsI [Candidatus Zixiibacteriota bacterium]
MAKKSFIVMLVLLLGTFAFGMTLKYYRPSAPKAVPLSTFPTSQDGWHARSIPITADVIDLLKPDAIYNAFFTDSQGVTIDLFFSYFAAENSTGGVHSPRNCMPGSGWVIMETAARPVTIDGRSIPAARMKVKYGTTVKVVDYWYVTRHGETASDFGLKWYEMLSALALKPTDVSFIRFVTSDDPASLSALERFEQTFGREVYRVLPFGK